MAEMVLYHNQNCSTSRNTLALAKELGVDAEVVQYLKAPLDRTGLEQLLAILEDPPADLVRKDPHFKELGLDATDYVEADAVIDLLVAHPKLMQRPVLVRGDRAIIGRPPERARAFLEEASAR